MNPRDGSPIDPSSNYDITRGVTHFLGTPFSEWMDAKLLADEEGISIRELVQRYRLHRYGARHRQQLKPVVSLGMIWEAQENLRLKIDRRLVDAAMLPGPIEYVRPVPVEVKLERGVHEAKSMARRAFDEAEAVRARQSLLEERTASLERRLAKLANV